MVSKGAANIVLVSRSGTTSGPVATLVEEMAIHGANIHVRACDVADKDAVTNLIEKDLAGMPPIRGVIHGAMVLNVSHSSPSTQSSHLITTPGRPLRKNYPHPIHNHHLLESPRRLESPPHPPILPANLLHRPLLRRRRRRKSRSSSLRRRKHIPQRTNPAPPFPLSPLLISRPNCRLRRRLPRRKQRCRRRSSQESRLRHHL